MKLRKQSINLVLLHSLCHRQIHANPNTGYLLPDASRHLLSRLEPYEVKVSRRVLMRDIFENYGINFVKLLGLIIEIFNDINPKQSVGKRLKQNKDMPDLSLQGTGLHCSVAASPAEF